MKRRAFLSIAAAAATVPLRAQQPPVNTVTSPLICLNSKAVSQVGYSELGEIVQQLGFDGLDLAVYPGGHVEPRLAPVDLVRAIETTESSSLAIPIITTALTAATEQWAPTVVAISGRSGVGLFKCAAPRFVAAQDSRISQAVLRRNFLQLAALGRQYGCALTVPLRAGEQDWFLSEWSALLGDLDPHWAGLAIDSAYFAPESALTADVLRAMGPRVHAITVRDVGGRKTSDASKAHDPRPLGEGSVDFEKLFAELARINFRGPLSLEREYYAKDEPGAMSRDAAFVRKHLHAAYGRVS